MKIKIAILALICFGQVSGLCADSRDTLIDAQLVAPNKADSTMTDGKAKVYALEGKAIITPQGSPVEKALKVGDEIQAGDSVYTEKGTILSISFDKGRKNAVRIPADSKVIFTSIEPTNIKLENGSIFSVINGLAKGSTWKVTTPSAVAAVRGTVFLVRYESASGQMYAATVNVPDDGKSSAIEIQSLTGGGSAEIVEGKEISIKEGESPSSEMVQDLSPDQIAEVQAFFEQVSAESEAIEKSGDGEDATGEKATTDGEGTDGETTTDNGDGASDGEKPTTDDGGTGPGEDVGNDLGTGPGEDIGNDLGGGPGDDSLPPIEPGPGGDGDDSSGTKNDDSDCKAAGNCGDGTGDGN